MSASDRFWLAVQRRVSGMQPDVQRSILKAFKILRENLNEADLAKLIDEGGLARLFSAFDDGPFSDATLERAFLAYRQEVRGVVSSAFDTTVRTALPNGGKVDGVVGVAFDTLSADVIQAIRTMETKSLTTLKDDVRDTVRAVVENGIRDGKSPRVIAKDLRASVGLSPDQLEQVENYRFKLATGRSVSSYTLRDERHDGKPMSLERIDKAAETYRSRRIKLNAETNARTATLDAYKQGQNLAWKQAIDSGVVEQGSLVKTWKGVLDNRERPEHVAMQGETVGFDETFSNGEMVPGESTYNCRCVAITRVDTKRQQLQSA